MSEIPYTTKTPWWYRLIFPPLGIIFFLLVPFSEWIEAWQTWTWTFRLIIIWFVAAFLVGSFGAFLRRVIFNHESIEYRNFLGITKIKNYKDIVDIKATEQNIRIIFSDNSSIKVWTGEGNIHRVLRIIKKKREEK